MDKQGKAVRIIGLSSNGSDVQAGIMTRDWDPERKSPMKDNSTHINVVVFPDCSTPFTRGSIKLHIDEQEARKAYSEDSSSKEPRAWLID